MNSRDNDDNSYDAIGVQRVSYMSESRDSNFVIRILISVFLNFSFASVWFYSTLYSPYKV